MGGEQQQGDSQDRSGGMEQEEGERTDQPEEGVLVEKGLSGGPVEEERQAGPE